MRDLIAEIWDWGHEEDWTTWLAHGVFAGLAAWVFEAWVGFWPAVLAGSWGYAWREIGQVARKLVKRQPVPWADSWLDVLFAFLGAVVGALLGVHLL